MNKKQWRKPERFLLYIGLMLLLSPASCVPPTKIVTKQKEIEIVSREVVKKEVVEKEICSHRDFLQSLQGAGGFEKALKKNQRILSTSPKTPPGDEALFNIGLIYAHPENPQKDYKQSLAYFQRVVKEFPRSQLIQEARMWIGVLEDIENAMKVDIEIEEMKKGLSK